MTVLPKLFTVPVAAPTILFIVTSLLVKFPVQVGVGVFSSLIVTEAVAGATIVKKVFQFCPAASLIFGMVSIVSILVQLSGGANHKSVLAEPPFEIA